MEGVTTAIVGFIFLGAAFPHLIKNRAQYYISLVIVVVIVLLDALGHMGDATGALHTFCYVFAAIAQVAAVVILVLCSGGLTVGQFREEMGNAIELVRRGESEKEVIIPLSDAAKKIKAEADFNRSAGRRASTEDSPQVYHIDDTPSAGAPLTPPTAPEKKPDRGPLPLD
jgi:hypothetical protein